MPDTVKLCIAELVPLQAEKGVGVPVTTMVGTGHNFPSPVMVQPFPPLAMDVVRVVRAVSEAQYLSPVAPKVKPVLFCDNQPVSVAS